MATRSPKTITDHEEIQRWAEERGGRPACVTLIYQDRTAQGQKSNFNKLVGRDTAEQRKRGNAHASRHRKPASKSAARSTKASSRRGTQKTSGRSRKSA